MLMEYFFDWTIVDQETRQEELNVGQQEIVVKQEEHTVGSFYF